MLCPQNAIRQAGAFIKKKYGSMMFIGTIEVESF
jgi:hypothetical protein